jgi:phage tail-like protein
MPTGQRPKDPYSNFNFLVEIDGIIRAAFQEASGFDSSIDITEHREGGENTTMRKLPAMTKYSNITLKWGTTDDRELYDWHRQWITGDPAAQRKNGSVVLLDRAGQEKVRWNFFNAWPAKWTGPSLNAEGPDVAVEAAELVVEGLERA